MKLLTKFGNQPKDQSVLNGMFISYGTNIAQRIDGRITLDEHYWDYSATTGYYRNQFLGEDITMTRNKILSGEYRLLDLNN